MSAPIIWIVVPALLSLILFFLRERIRLITVIGTITAFLLAVVAWFIPFEEIINLGPLEFELTASYVLLGRQFVLDAAKSSVLVLLYGVVAFWFAGSKVANTNTFFVPGGLLVVSLLVGALAVEPFLYAALFIEMAVLVTIPMLISPGSMVGRGILRYLTFQTLGKPFILFTGWLLAGVESSPGDSTLVLHASILLIFGFIFLLAVFPFHSWIPMLANESHPYVAAYILYLFPMVIMLFGLGFLDRYVWLRSSPDLYYILRLSGTIMVIIGGIWGAFDKNLSRIMGYAVMMGIGFLLLALSVSPVDDGGGSMITIFMALLIPYGFGLGVWALALTVLSNPRDGEPPFSGKYVFENLQGKANKFPLAASSLVLAIFSSAGFPLLAGYPPRFALWTNLTQQNPLVTLATLLGSTGLIIAGLRTISVLVQGLGENPYTIMESRVQRILLVLGMLLLLIGGIMPQIFSIPYSRLAEIFVHLGNN